MNKWPIKILHLGLGRFHRAHQAIYYQTLFEKFGHSWGVVAFSMQSAKACDQLRAVDNRYPVIEIEQEKARVRWVEAIRESYFAIDHFQKLMACFSTAEIEIVSLTITEKAYLLNAQGHLNTALVKQDLANQERPQTAIGMLYLGLKTRKNILKKPMTVLSCDNLCENGNKLKQVILDYAMLLDDQETKDWIEQRVSFPNSMVDRIVPALTQEKIATLQKQFNITHAELLAAESFSQWVIEDNFKTERPPLEKVDVLFVENVKPFENIKLRLLNAAHSLIAYSGIIRNYTYVHEAIRDPVIKTEVLCLFEEVMPFLKPPNRLDLKNYTQCLIKRFDNPLLPHPLKQIAMDGSQKLLQRIFPSLREACQKHTSSHYLNLTIYYWMQYCYLQEIEDPLKEKILALKQSSPDFDSFKERLWNHLNAL